MDQTHRYIRTETVFSAIGSGVATVGMYFAVFGASGQIAVRSMGGYAFDFAPQSFMTALLCTWLPGLITRKRIARGTVPTAIGATGATPKIESLLIRGFAFGAASLVLAAGPVALALLSSGLTELDWTAGLMGKILFSAVVAVIITPIGLRAILHERARSLDSSRS